MTERIQKILSNAGYGSRRACEQMIVDKRVQVNGNIAQLGDKADPDTDVIKLDGKAVNTETKKTYVLLYKPRGYVSTTKPETGQRSVLELVEVKAKVYPVGRLDQDSEGLILLTNDGELTQQLTHPKYEHEKEYRVLLAEQPGKEALASWRKGVVLEDGYKTKPCYVEFQRAHGKGAWIKVIMKEGHKRQIRETARVLGFPVVKLIRMRVGPLKLGNLKKGEWRFLNDEEISELTSSLHQ
ncbi:MAG: rRNA pseudouridine synthase [Anaerolineales bacterium]|nr:rRNA pseudouridine synthase [Anaerolineales bacterium]